MPHLSLCFSRRLKLGPLPLIYSDIKIISSVPLDACVESATVFTIINEEIFSHAIPVGNISSESVSMPLINEVKNCLGKAK
jgi:hypothetical protein